METPRSPFNTDSNLYSTTAKPNYVAYNQSNTDYNARLATNFIVYISIIFSIEIPIICLAIYAVYSLIKSKQAAPVFVINLLISDLITNFSLLPLNFNWVMLIISGSTFIWAGFTGLYFMACIAVERYILIAHPVWHRSHRSVTYLVCTSLIGWLTPFIPLTICYFINSLAYIMPFIPYAVIIVCFVGACRSLSHSISLTPLKQQIVLTPLFFVVISYTVLILPLQIYIFLCENVHEPPLSLFRFTFFLYPLNPLMDSFLYVFVRSDSDTSLLLQTEESLV